jgi:DNA-3-methyladenine glycosylase I
MVRYHDEEWGVPEHDDRALFELLLLEGFQAGLSWRTILHKREAFRRAFDGFDPERLAAYGDAEHDRLMADAGIVRNRLKLRGAVQNARAFLALRDEVGPFAPWLWSFVDGEPRLPQAPLRPGDVPASTPDAERVSKALKRAGFTFVGPTIVYAFLQSAGLVDDHVVGCFRYRGPAPPGGSDPA